METYTNQPKSSSTFANGGITGVAFWGDASVTWGDSIGAWGENRASYTDGVKSSSTFANVTKN